MDFECVALPFVAWLGSLAPLGAALGLLAFEPDDMRLANVRRPGSLRTDGQDEDSHQTHSGRDGRKKQTGDAEMLRACEATVRPEAGCWAELGWCDVGGPRRSRSSIGEALEMAVIVEMFEDVWAVLGGGGAEAS